MRLRRLIAFLAFCLLWFQALAATPFAYITSFDANDVTPIDVATNQPGPAITVGTQPTSIAVTPDGTTAYVCIYDENSVVPITLATGVTGPAITVGANPCAIAITPDGTMAYVCNQSSNTITPITLISSTPGTAITVGARPNGIAITPDGTTSYVCIYNENTVVPITLVSGATGPAITVGSHPNAIAITPDGKTVYVCNNDSDFVTPITVTTNTAGSPITVGSQPNAIAITPDGTTAYVGLGYNPSVKPITVATGVVGTAISLDAVPTQIAVTPDGTKAYVSCWSSTDCIPIDLTTQTAGTAITVGNSSAGGVITPDQAPTASFLVSMNDIAVRTVACDGSASSSPLGTISTFSWDFGDGSSSSLSYPTTTHTYAKEGLYTISLTVTNSSGTSTSKVFTGQTMYNNGGASARTSKICAVTTGGWLAISVGGGNDNGIDHFLVPADGPISQLSLSYPNGAVAITPDGTTAIVGNYNDNYVSFLDLMASPVSLKTTLETSASTQTIAITPDGTTALVVSYNSMAVFVIRDLTSSPYVSQTVSLEDNPSGVAITPDGTTALVTTNSLLYVLTIGPTVSVPNSIPLACNNFSGYSTPAIYPDGTKALVGYSSDQIAVIDLANKPTISIVATVTVGSSPFAVSINPTGTLALVSNNTSAGGIVLLDLTQTPITTQAVSFSNPFFSCFSPDGTRAYVQSNASPGYVYDYTVSAPNISLNNIISTQAYPSGIAIAPDQAPTAAFTMSIDDLTVSFDGSSSSSPLGTIAAYSWDYGDGYSYSSPFPTTSHTYATKGIYTVSLTVTNSAGTSTSKVFTGQTLSNNGGASAKTSKRCVFTTGTSVSTPTVYGTSFDANDIYIIDVTTNTIETPIAVGTQPTGIAITPDGTTAYVCIYSNGTVLPVTLATGTVGTAIAVGSNPWTIAITPDGKTAYAGSRYGTAVTPINLTENVPGAPITVESGAMGIAITPDGKTAYVCNYNSNSVSPIDLATNLAGTAIAVGSGPWGLAITPDGKMVYVANSNDYFVTPINVATNTAGQPITVLSQPQTIAITPDGTTAYVGLGNNSVTPITIATGAVGTAISIDSSPTQIAITPDGTKAYVSCWSSTHCIPIDLTTQTAGPALIVGNSSSCCTISPDQAPTASFTTAINGSTALLDGSASWSPVGGISQYQWDFGDGSTATTTSPLTTHTYTSSGMYTISLAVTNSTGTSTTQVFTGQTMLRNGSAIARSSKTYSFSTGSQTWRAVVTGGESNPQIIDVPSDEVEGTSVTAAVSGHVAITPDGTMAVTAGSGAVFVLDLSQPVITPVAVPGFSNPRGVAITPDGTRALVADNNRGAVGVVDLLASPIAVVTWVGGIYGPIAVAITPDGTQALVAPYGDPYHPLIVLNIGQEVTYGYGIEANLGYRTIEDIAVTPDGTKAFATDGTTSELLVFNIAQSPFTYAYGVSVGHDPQGLAVTPDGTTAVVVNKYNSTLSVLDLTQSPISSGYTVPIPNGGQDIAITPDGKLAYVTCQGSNAVAVFDLTKLPILLVDQIGLGALQPYGVAITPDQAPTASFTISTVGLSVALDGSASSSPTGDIIQYDWDFGDGITETTVSSIISHTYKGDGIYTISLTVTNTAGTSTTKVFTGKTLSNNGGPSAKASTTLLFGAIQETAFITQGTGSSGAVYHLPIPFDTGAGPIPDNNVPVDVAITPDNTKALVVNNSNATITIIDLTQASLPQTPVPVGNNPTSIAITPDGTRALVTNASDGTVSVIDILDGTTEPAVSVGSFPKGIAITPDGLYALVANSGDGTVSVLSIGSSVQWEYNVSPDPGISHSLSGIAITPNGTTAFVTSSDNDTVYAFSLTSPPFTYGSSFAVQSQPTAIAIDPAETFVMVANTGSGSVSLYSFSSTDVTNINVGTGVNGVCITPDGKHAYITFSTGITNVYNITPSSMTFLYSTTLSAPLTGGIAITPDQAPTASFTTSFNGSAVCFDASNSSSPWGTIVQYQWNFGDTSSLTSSSPVASHTYGAPGLYTVTLTVVNTNGTSTNVVFTGKTVSNNGGSSAEETHTIDVGSIEPTAFVTWGYVDGPTAYGVIYPIALSSGATGAPINDPNVPVDIAVTPDCSKAVVVNNYTATVTILDLFGSPLQPGYDVAVGASPAHVAITPDGKRALVTNTGSNSVSILDLTQSPVVEESRIFLGFGKSPIGVAITPDGTMAFVSNYEENTISVLSLGETVTVIETVSAAGSSPNGIAVTPNGKLALVAINGASQVNVFTIEPSNILYAAAVGLHGGASPSNIAVNSTGTLAVVTNGGDDTVSVLALDPNPQNIYESCNISVSPASGISGVAITPDGGNACVSMSSGVMNAYSVTPTSISYLTTITLAYPLTGGIAVTPDQSPTAVLTISETAPLTLHLDGSSSTPPLNGEISTYYWDFGDGTQTTTVPPYSSTDHVYAATGTYTPSLTVEDTNGTSNTITFTGKEVSNYGLPQAKASKTFVFIPLGPTVFATQGYQDATGTYGAVFHIPVPANSPVGPITDNNLPVDVAFLPDGSTMAVVDRASSTMGVIPLFSKEDFELSFSESLPVGNAPSSIAVSPDGGAIFVTNQADGTVTVFFTAGGGSVVTIPVGTSPYAVAVTPDGTRALVTNYGEGTISVLTISGETVALSQTLSGVGVNPAGIAMTPDGTTAIVALYGEDSAALISLSDYSQTKISVQSQPTAVAIDSKGTVAIVINSGSGSASLIDLSTLGVTNIAIGAGVNGIAITPDGGTAYLALSSGTAEVYTITPTSMTRIATVALAENLTGGIGITPDQAPTAAFGLDLSSLPEVSVDASGSSTPVGTIASYTWDFGDGAVFTTNTSSFNHLYTSGGLYTVSLTVTNSNGTSTTQTFTGKSVSNNGGPSAKLSYTFLYNSVQELAFVTQGSVDNGAVYHIPIPSDSGVGSTLDDNLPMDVAFTPDNTKALIVNSSTNSVAIVDLSQKDIPQTVVGVGSNPRSIAITPDGSRALVTNKDDDTVSVIDLPDGTIEGSAIAVGAAPYGVAITIDGAYAIATNSEEAEPGPFIVQGDHSYVEIKSFVVTPLIR